MINIIHSQITLLKEIILNLTIAILVLTDLTTPVEYLNHVNGKQSLQKKQIGFNQKH